MAKLDKLYTLGAQGEDIADLQSLLGIDATGVYDEGTQAAVTQYQQNNGLTVDGVVGDETLNSILGSGANMSAPQQPQQQAQQPAAQPLTGVQDVTGVTSNVQGVMPNAPAQNAQLAQRVVDMSAITLPGISDATRQALSDLINNGYRPSQNVEAALKDLNDAIEKQPADFKSKWSGQIEAIMDKIINRDKFSYDFSTDPTYNLYKDIYQRQGRMAMMDTIGQSSALTGGYGNTWAQSAGQQAYNASLENLNRVIPELQQQAFNQYTAEGQQMRDAYGMMGDQRAQEMSEYQQAYNRWAADRDFAQSAYMNERNLDYDQYGNQLSYLQNIASQEHAQYNTDRQYAYSLAMQMIQNKNMPSADVLARAGLTKADAEKLMKRSGGGSSRSSGGGGGGGGAAASTPTGAATNSDVGYWEKVRSGVTAAQLYSDYKKTGVLPKASKYSKSVMDAFNKLRTGTK